MCGIVGYIGKQKKALEVLINGLEHLEYRGYDSSGIAYLLDNALVIKKAPGKIENLKTKVDFKNESNIGIGHTRWATHGEPNEINSHPHQCENITIVHNGIIENYLELKKELSAKGYTFVSETDTEVAATLLNDLYKNEKDILKAIIAFKNKALGAYAIALLCNNEPDTLYAIKKNSPLIIGIGETANYLASDVPAIIDYTNKYLVLDDGSYAKITSNEVSVYNSDNKLINNDIKTFDNTYESNDKMGYDHYMLKEIHEEPLIIKRNASITDMPNISNYQRIVITACGSAMHAGLIGKCLIEKYLDIPVEVEIASEFRYKKLFINADTLVIAISQSGETADTLEAVKIAKNYGSHTLGIINVKDSSIARAVDDVIYTKAGREIAVATTKAYLAQIEMFILLIYETLKSKNIPTITNTINCLNELAIFTEKLINNNNYEAIAQRLYQKKDIFFIGRGIDYALCMEASLKLKEISYIHSEAYAAGELKHGTISLIEKDTPVIGIVTDETIADKTISNLKEVKSRGAYVIYVTTDKLAKQGDFYDECLIVPTTNYLLQPLITIIPLQLVAYYIAKYKGCDIDKPKNLAKSVTVE